MRGISAAFCAFGLAVAGLAAPPALAATTGGANVPSPLTGSGLGSGAEEILESNTPAGKPENAPVTAKNSVLIYNGPVYEKTATGEIVTYPYTNAIASSTKTQKEPLGTGGTAVTPTATATSSKPLLLVPGKRARLINGLAAAPMAAPAAVQEMIWAANKIVGDPYIYGGGHNPTFLSPGYDCSGTVSFALHGADLLASPEDSSEFMGWGAAGVGTWVTIFSNPGHAYMTVAGLRLDTSSADDPSNEQGPRWRPLRQSNGGYTVRHPVGL